MDDEYTQLSRQRQLRVKQFAANPSNIGATNNRAKSAFNPVGSGSGGLGGQHHRMGNIPESATYAGSLSGRRSVGLNKQNVGQDHPNTLFDRNLLRSQQQASQPQQGHSSRLLGNNRRMVDNSWYDVGRNELTSGEDDTNSELELSSFDNHSSSRLALNNSYSYAMRRPQPYTPELDSYTVYYLSQVRLSPDIVQSLFQQTPPPPLFYTLKKPVEKAAYIYLRYLYGAWKFSRSAAEFDKFLNIFNREFFNQKCQQLDDTAAFMKICEHAQREYHETMNKRAAAEAKLREEQLSADSYAATDERSMSDRVDMEKDVSSLDSVAREPKFFNEPHTPVSFAVGGRLVRINLEASICTVLIEDLKSLCRNRQSLAQAEMLETFKGPYISNLTPTNIPLLFVERQIERILNSQHYRANPTSVDTNDCLLIWKLLQLLIRQQGKVTGHDLACLLISNTSSNSTTVKASLFLKAASSSRSNRSSSDQESDGQYPPPTREDLRHQQSMDRLTSFLFGGYVEEAVDSAIRSGLHFEALFLANRMFREDPKKLAEIETRLLSYWKPQQHPTMTLIQVASGIPIQLPANQEDSGWWRPHVAVLLANLNTATAMQVVYQLGIELAKREFNSAADFCFLAINLLTGRNCFAPMEPTEGDDCSLKGRSHISLIKASLPDDDNFSLSETHFGWSILDYQATEIYDYALGLANLQNPTPPPTPLQYSIYYQQCRLQYAQLLDHFGGFSSAVAQYCSAIAFSIWHYANSLDKQMLMDLCDLAQQMEFMSGRPASEFEWVKQLRSSILPSETTQPNVFGGLGNNKKQKDQQNVAPLKNQHSVLGAENDQKRQVQQQQIQNQRQNEQHQTAQKSGKAPTTTTDHSTLLQQQQSNKIQHHPQQQNLMDHHHQDFVSSHKSIDPTRQQPIPTSQGPMSGQNVSTFEENGQQKSPTASRRSTIESLPPVPLVMGHSVGAGILPSVNNMTPLTFTDSPPASPKQVGAPLVAPTPIPAAVHHPLPVVEGGGAPQRTRLQQQHQQQEPMRPTYANVAAPKAGQQQPMKPTAVRQQQPFKQQPQAQNQPLVHKVQPQHHPHQAQSHIPPQQVQHHPQQKIHQNQQQITAEAPTRQHMDGERKDQQKQQTTTTTSGGGGSGWGLFGAIKKTIISKIPDKNAPNMILPDDNSIPDEQKLRWDETTGKWMGAAEEYVPPPPPMMLPSGVEGGGGGNQFPPTQGEPLTAISTQNQQQQQQQREETAAVDPTPVVPMMINPAEMPIVGMPPPVPSAEAGTQQKRRYATAWDQ